jgi:hypothetical protein
VFLQQACWGVRIEDGWPFTDSKQKGELPRSPSMSAKQMCFKGFLGLAPPPLS